MVTNTNYLFNTNAKSYRYLITIGLCFFLLCLRHAAYCSAPDTSLINKKFFEQINRFPAQKKIEAINKLYKNTFRKASTAVAMANLDRLSALARSQNDKQLECAVFDMRADYYSVNKGYNALSSSYYRQVIDFSKANNLPVETGIYLNKWGVYEFVYKHYTLACRHFLDSQEEFNQIGYDNVPDIGNYLFSIAKFYYSFDDYENAKINLEEALKYIPDSTRTKLSIINTIGLIYRNYRQFPQALTQFNKTLQLAAAIKDTVWMGIATGNIGSVYFLQNQYQKALPYLENDYNSSLKYGEVVNATMALLRLVKINIDYKKYDLANQQLQSVEALLKTRRVDVLPQWADYYDLKSQLDEQLGKIAESMAYRKKFELNKDSLAKRNNIAAVERVKLRWEIDKHTTQLNKLRYDEKISTIKMYASIAVLVLLGIISLLVYNRQRLKSEKDKELLIAEKRVVDEELKSAGMALQAFTENLREKNYLIEQFKQEIDRLNWLSTGKENAVHLEKLLEAHIMTSESWNDFKRLFLKVYPGFFVSLSKNHPHLSGTDTRMLALIKLGLNNSEMANMLGITVEGIKKAKQRLRKKIDIDIVKDASGSNYSE